MSEIRELKYELPDDSVAEYWCPVPYYHTKTLMMKKYANAERSLCGQRASGYKNRMARKGCDGPNECGTVFLLDQIW